MPKRRAFTSYTDAYYSVKSLTDLALIGAEKLTEQSNRERAAHGWPPDPTANLEAWKEHIRGYRTALNRVLKERYGKR